MPIICWNYTVCDYLFLLQFTVGVRSKSGVTVATAVILSSSVLLPTIFLSPLKIPTMQYNKKLWTSMNDCTHTGQGSTTSSLNFVSSFHFTSIQFTDLFNNIIRYQAYDFWIIYHMLEGRKRSNYINATKNCIKSLHFRI